MRSPTEHGNALFLILIVVALFAALSFAVTQGLRSDTKNTSNDRQVIGGAEITQYTTFIAETVMKMRFRGVEDTGFCFDSPSWGDNRYDHPGCTTEAHQVFGMGADGGHVSWMRPSPGSNQGEVWIVTGQTCIPGLGLSQEVDCHADGDPSNEDLVIFLPNISHALCVDINKRLGVENPNGSPPKASGDLWPSASPFFIGSYNDGGRIDSSGSGDMAVLHGRSFGCVEGGGTPPVGTYAYFHVLLRR